MFRLYWFDPTEEMPSIERMMTRIHPDDRALYQGILARSAGQEEPFAFDLRLLFEDGTLIWGHIVGNVEKEATGQAVRRFGTFMDVTTQKLLEMALRKSQGQLNLAQQVAQLGSWEYDLVTGSVTWSLEMFRLLDLNPTQEALDYATNLTLYHAEDAALLDTCVQQAVTKEKDYELDPRQAEKPAPPRAGTTRSARLFKTKPGRWYSWWEPCLTSPRGSG